MKKIIKKSGLAYTVNGSILLCRPFAFPELILPGGIIEPDEDEIERLKIEISEELGMECMIELDTISYLGNFIDIAAGRENVLVDISLYKGDISGPINASDEIKDLVWVSQFSASSFNLSPILKNKIFPFLINLGLI